jgi:hypothetical protein
MHFASDDIIDAPAPFAFGRMSRFGDFERLAAERGAEMTRLDTMTEAGIGVMWELRFNLRGRRRRIDLQLSDYVEPTRIAISGMSDGLLFQFDATLDPVAAERCRLCTRLVIKPRTLAGRMMLQSARLSKPSLNRRYARRLRDFAARVAERYAAAGAPGDTPR